VVVREKPDVASGPSPNEAGHQIQDSQAKLLVAVSADAAYGVPVLAVDELSTRPIATLPPPEVGPDDLALPIHTSGSTGRPTGVRLDHANEDQRPDLSAVRFAVCGAARVQGTAGARGSRFGFPIIEGYAPTEGTCASTVNPLDGVRKPGTVGTGQAMREGIDTAPAFRLAVPTRLPWVWDVPQSPHHLPGSAGGTISRLRILPVGPFGSVSTTHTLRGYLYAATWRLT